MPLEHWFTKPNPKKTESDALPPTVRDITPQRVARQIAIIGRVRKRLVHQRRALHELTRAYTGLRSYLDRREETISELRSRVVELERQLEAKKAGSLKNFFQRWFNP